MILAFALATMFLSITYNKILWIMIGLAAAVPRLHETRVTDTQVAGAR
jgi:hypothetical protein